MGDVQFITMILLQQLHTHHTVSAMSTRTFHQLLAAAISSFAAPAIYSFCALADINHIIHSCTHPTLCMQLPLTQSTSYKQLPV